MRYLSICSGIEAVSVAWKPLGWTPIAFAEIDPFPCAVLASRFPEVPNVGDISKVDWRSYEFDLLVGGTPCQSFSIAGNRTALDGASGLVREYFRILHECNPRFFVWENVVGALSADGGRAFRFLLKQWDDCGYSVAWRVLSAEGFGVPQARRRVFVVGYSGGWEVPAHILFEQEDCGADTAKLRRDGTAAPAFCGYLPALTLRDRHGKPGGGKGPLISVERSLTLATTNDQLLFDGRGIRQLTCTEAERLMGFPDGWTAIDGAKDSQRHKALGNSMCVPVMRWIGERIQALEESWPSEN